MAPTVWRDAAGGHMHGDKMACRHVQLFGGGSGGEAGCAHFNFKVNSHGGMSWEPRQGRPGARQARQARGKAGKWASRQACVEAVVRPPFRSSISRTCVGALATGHAQQCARNRAIATGHAQQCACNSALATCAGHPNSAARGTYVHAACAEHTTCAGTRQHILLLGHRALHHVAAAWPTHSWRSRAVLHAKASRARPLHAPGPEQHDLRELSHARHQDLGEVPCVKAGRLCWLPAEATVTCHLIFIPAARVASSAAQALHLVRAAEPLHDRRVVQRPAECACAHSRAPVCVLEELDRRAGFLEAARHLGAVERRLRKATLQRRLVPGRAAARQHLQGEEALRQAARRHAHGVARLHAHAQGHLLLTRQRAQLAYPAATARAVRHHHQPLAVLASPHPQLQQPVQLQRSAPAAQQPVAAVGDRAGVQQHLDCTAGPREPALQAAQANR
eukprot:364635-Chlamydomonas_euryale.AAC.5